MIIKENVSLKEMTTIKIGGIAKKLYIPQSKEDLETLFLKYIKSDAFYIISGGSNILINDKKIYNHVIYLNQLDKRIFQIKNNLFYIGCSNRIQMVINTINQMGYGGFEDLISLPALFGGIVCMNAGVGGRFSPKFNISDFVKRVYVFNTENKMFEYLDNDKCMFSYRKSIFKNGKYIIIGAEVELKEQKLDKSKKIKKERLQKVKEHQIWDKGCFGTCFSNASTKILKFVSFITFNKKGIYQPKNNPNWLCNDGTGTYKKAINIINKAKFFHKILKKEIECEVVIWK